LILQKLFILCPVARVDMSDSERQEIRTKWYTQLAVYVDNLIVCRVA
jgi:hypothetical protein